MRLLARSFVAALGGFALGCAATAEPPPSDTHGSGGFQNTGGTSVDGTGGTYVELIDPVLWTVDASDVHLYGDKLQGHYSQDDQEYLFTVSPSGMLTSELIGDGVAPGERLPHADGAFLLVANDVFSTEMGPTLFGYPEMTSSHYETTYVVMFDAARTRLWALDCIDRLPSNVCCLNSPFENVHGTHAGGGAAYVWGKYYWNLECNGSTIASNDGSNGDGAEVLMRVSATGGIEWSKPMPYGEMEPWLDGGLFMVHSTSARTIDAGGNAVWTRSLPLPATAHAVGPDGAIYVFLLDETDGNSLLAKLDAKTGDTIWEISAPARYEYPHDVSVSPQNDLVWLVDSAYPNGLRAHSTTDGNLVAEIGFQPTAGDILTIANVAVDIDGQPVVYDNGSLKKFRYPQP
jgi:hypothetical protein